MATYKVLGDVVAAIQARSTSAVTYAVQNSTTYVGFMDVLRNGTRTWSFLFAPLQSSGYAMSGAATDANPTGALIQLIGPDGVSGKSDVANFIASLN